MKLWWYHAIEGHAYGGVVVGGMTERGMRKDNEKEKD